MQTQKASARTDSLERWHAWAVADARARNLDGLPSLVDGLAAAIARLRSVDWIGDPPPRDTGEPAADGGA